MVLFRWANAKDWPVESVSANVASVFGHTSRDFINGAVSYAQLIHPGDLKRVALETAKANSAGVTNFAPLPYRVIRSDGAERWVESHVRLMRDADGIITHYLGYVMDVTDQRETEEAHFNSTP